MPELEVDWPALHSAFQMNMPEVRCFFSLEQGTVIKAPPGDPQLATMRGAQDHYAPIEAIPSRIQYQWLDEFIRSIEDEALRKRMEASINGKGAFRRFKDILLTLPDERRRWFEFRDAHMRERIVEWVYELGVQPTNEPPWKDGATTLAAKPAEQACDPHDIEALRELLVEWTQGKGVEALTPLALDALASHIGEKFFVRTKRT